MKKHKALTGVLGVALALALISGGCLSDSQTPDDGVIYTQAAQTVLAEFTREASEHIQQTAAAGETAVALLTQIAQPTPTWLPTVTPTLQPTSTPLPSPTPLPPTPTSIPVPCDRVDFIGDITTEDSEVIAPNTDFTKTWRLKNAGTCTWTTDYALVFYYGAKMSAPDVVALTGTVRPGEMIDLSVGLTSPDRDGVYTGFWALRNRVGVLFGTGADASQPFWVKIEVVGGQSVVRDMTEDICDATMLTPETRLRCPPPGLDIENGFVYRDDALLIETGAQEDEPAVVMYPSSGEGGYVLARYPVYTIRRGDHFKAVVGCTIGSPGCNVVFQLAYSTDSEAETLLGQWNEYYDGKLTHVNVDLSTLAGKQVALILKVLDNGDSTDDWAFWLYPRIVR